MHAFLTRHAEWQRILLLLISTRFALTAVGLAAMVVLPISSRHLGLLPDFAVLEMWAQWDAAHYVSIAVEGYQQPSEPFSNITFFPLYPWLIRLVALPFGPLTEQGAALSGLAIANIALFVALLYLAALVERDFSLSAARRTVLYTLVFPTTLFLSSVYAEPLFLATAVASLYHARRGEWYAAGLAGGLAALTRPFGVLIVLPLLVELYRQRAPVRAWPAVTLVPAGLAVFFGYLWLQFGDPLAYMTAGRSWGRGFHWPWETLLGYLQGPMTMFDWPYAWLDLISMGAMVGLATVGLRLLPASYSAYTVASLLLALSTGIAWFSASRHAMAIFPLLIVLAAIGGRSRSFHWAWLAFSIVLAALFMARVAVGYWVT